MMKKCQFCESYHQDDNRHKWGPEDFEERKRIEEMLKDIRLALFDPTLTDEELGQLDFQYVFNKLLLIGMMSLDELQFYYAGRLQYRSNTPKQREVYRLKLDGKTEEDIAKELGVSRRAVRERMVLVQKKGSKATSEAKQFTDYEELKLKVIHLDKPISEIYKAIEKGKSLEKK